MIPVETNTCVRTDFKKRQAWRSVTQSKTPHKTQTSVQLIDTELVPKKMEGFLLFGCGLGYDK